jgi:tetratricopeptide (TPR) repeat protein
VGAQASYLSQNDLTEHVGLGTVTEVDSLIVTWPSGLRQAMGNVAAGQTIHIVEGVKSLAIPEFWSLYREATNARSEGRFAAARDAYRQALALNDRHEDVLYYLGNMEFELGNFRAAEIAWRRLAEINSASARAHSRLGDLYACPDAGAPWDLRRAEAEYARASALNREETGPLLRLGEVALLQGDLKGAAQHFTAVIATHPRSVEAHYLKGYVAWKRGDKAAAGAAYRDAEAFTRAALAAAPPAVPSEGDTKHGTTPLVVHPARCQLFGSDLAPYATLDRRLQQVAPPH